MCFKYQTHEKYLIENWCSFNTSTSDKYKKTLINLDKAKQLIKCLETFYRRKYHQRFSTGGFSFKESFLPRWRGKCLKILWKIWPQTLFLRNRCPSIIRKIFYFQVFKQKFFNCELFTGEFLFRSNLGI